MSNFEEKLNEVDERIYHKVENVLNHFKNGETYSNCIDEITSICIAEITQCREDTVRDYTEWLLTKDYIAPDFYTEDTNAIKTYLNK